MNMSKGLGRTRVGEAVASPAPTDDEIARLPAEQFDAILCVLACDWRERVRLLELWRSAAAAEKQPHITFTYRNWRGEVAMRTVRPVGFWYGSTEWHPEPQVFLKALDTRSGAMRDFAVRDMTFGASLSPTPESQS